MSSSNLIVLEHVGFQINHRTILQNIDLPITKAELLTIVGPNGAGKTTLMRLILGHFPPTSGRIIRRDPLKIAYVPQSFHVPADFPITVRRFLKGLNYQQENSPLVDLSIAHLLDSPLQNLSGGETQRLLLARAMLSAADMIVLDEPASGIDPSALEQYYQQIRRYQLRTQCAVVLVSHDIHLVMAASDQVLCLNQHICCMGKPEDIAHHPDFQNLLGAHPQDQSILGFYSHHHSHQHL